MGLNLWKKLSLLFKRIPRSTINEIDRCFQKLVENNIKINFQQFTNFYFAGADITQSTESLIFAKNNALEIQAEKIFLLDIAGYNTLEVIKNSMLDHVMEIQTYSPQSEKKMMGYCCDGTKVFANIRLIYRLTIESVFGPKISHVQERLSTNLAVMIHEADNWDNLHEHKTRYEALLISIASEMKLNVKSLEITFLTETQI